ncbi:NnrS family protein [Pseudoduganella aquatica]|uniref:NnrS family protein n=1 Tax=Pseudoduganella aquatica TaxID=2660641 RepID=A0A7X4HG36_9BURK|nr:NnrS family protein [Pseudoduganella aquatica]MYN10133.1 NnrS family protein [Pseudoduganella aquatica]
MSLLHIDEPAAALHSAGHFSSHPLWRLGFRPFYLAAALFAALAVPLWVARLYGWLDGSLAANVGLSWHMHEMVFGMASAVIVGFLYTAGRNWTGLWTPVGGRLAALLGLWLAGRAAMLLAPPALAALVDTLFLPVAAWPLFSVMRRAGNRRNYFLVGLLGLLAAANACYHAAVLGWLALAPAASVQAAILVIVVMESAIGTRVIPMFTRNGAPGSAPASHVRTDQVSIALLAASALAWTVGAPAWLLAPLAAAAGVLALLRLWRWQPQRTLRLPLLWILHLSYAWIGVGMLLLALSALGMAAPGAAFHALAVGSMAGLILGMMTRTTLGHTGRMLKARRAESAIFVLIQLGALARVAAALLDAAWAGPLHAALVLLSAAGWSTAFAVYALVYAPYLAGARIDGKEG